MSSNPLIRLAGAYALLAFGGGTWGLHRLFLGRPYTAVLYAGTGGILGLGVVFDALVGIPWMVLWTPGNMWLR